jgi:peptidoglycan/xylan/chitin deacetylase (PgdA/CDA1 family)
MKRRRRRHQKRKSSLNISKILLIIASLITLVLLFTVLKKNNIIFSSQSTNQSQQETSSSKTATSTPSSKATTENSKSDVSWVKQENDVTFPILMYHAIHIMAPEEAENANLIVAPDVFESHIKRLSEEGYYFLTPEEAYKVLSENVLPNDNPKIIWLTFDDSIWDFYDEAYPILTKYNAKATNNVITSTVGNNGSLSLDQMVEMKGNGMAFEDHTTTHPDLSVSSTEAQTAELEDSKDYLDSSLSQDTIAVAYPSGRYTDTTLQIAESLGYKLGVTTNEGLASRSDGLLSLNRVRILPTTTADSLLASITQ